MNERYLEPTTSTRGKLAGAAVFGAAPGTLNSVLKQAGLKK